MRLLTIIFVCVLLAACSSGPPRVIYGGTGIEDFEAEKWALYTYSGHLDRVLTAITERGGSVTTMLFKLPNVTLLVTGLSEQDLRDLFATGLIRRAVRFAPFSR